MNVPRSEYPRPQFVRRDWLCLNGEWQFEIDAGDSGLERGLLGRDLSDRIIVPFCPESPLSGIHNEDFLNAVWYRCLARIPQEWAGRRTLLHFEAVDYDTTVWVNGTEVGRHRGGFTPFICDLSGVAAPGEVATIVVRARDYRWPPQPRGKQSRFYAPWRSRYARTTGIWQTVWLEPVPEHALRPPRLTPDVANSLIRVRQPVTGNDPGLRVQVTLRDAQGVVSTQSCPADADLCPHLDLPIPAGHRRLWSPGAPYLYDLDIVLLDAGGTVIDRASSYAGLRAVTVDGQAIRINGEAVFQRLVLDQGYYPDGIMTAPSDEALRRDIELSLAAGFNGARLHEKVFEQRYLYHADRLGYLVWAEFADWGVGGFGPQEPGPHHGEPGPTYVAQWLEELERDYSHPCVVGWCAMNETGHSIGDHIVALDDTMRAMFLAAKAMDTSRPVLDVSGYSHRVPETDVFDCHDYEQDPVKFAARHAGLAEGKPYYNGPGERPWSIPYRGQPFFVSEFGGTWWNRDAEQQEEPWVYGRRPETIEEVYQRFTGLCGVLLDNPHMFGYCYTQLTDIYKEQNGIYTFDRRPKFDLERLRQVQQRPAAIERLHARR